MKLSDLSALFLEAERKFDVTAITWKGIELWPVFRANAKLLFKHEEKYQSRKKVSRKKLPFLSRIKIIASHSLKFRRSLKNLHVPGSRVLMVSRPEDYTETIGGKSYNRFVDPLLEDFNEAGIPTGKLLITFSSPSKTHNHFHPGNNFSAFDFENAFTARHPYDPTDPELNSKLAELENLSGIKINEEAFKFMCWKTWMYTRFFLHIMKKLKPEAVFIVSYDNAEWFGLNRASSILGIKTVDVQHGKQGKFNPPYSPWTKLPLYGYSVLPDWFWNWGEASAYNISQWLPDASQMKPIVGGNRWMGKWKEGAYEEQDLRINSLKETALQFNRVVLFSMQPINQPVPSHILEAVENSAEDILWLFRAHPRQLDQDWKNLLKGYKNIEWEKASALPLYTVLNGCNRHLTCWSSVAFEASHFGIPTMIIHEKGADIYGDTFPAGFSSREVLTWVRTGDTIVSNDNYILTDKATSINAVKAILKN